MTNENYSRPIILDKPFDKEAIRSALLTLMAHTKGHFWIILVGSETGQKIAGPAIALDVRGESGLIVRVPVDPLVPAQPEGNQMAQGGYNRALQAFKKGELLIKALLQEIGMDLPRNATIVGLGEENGIHTLSYTVLGLGIQNGFQNETNPVFTYDTGEQIEITIVEDIVFVAMIERDTQGKIRHLYTRGMGIDLPPWSLEFLRQGVEAGKIAQLKFPDDPRAAHNTSVLVASTEVELERLARETLISQAILKIFGMRNRDDFYQNPTQSEREALLKIVQQLKRKK